MKKKRKPKADWTKDPRKVMAVIASSAVREAFGFPCFHCGVPLAQCRKRKCCKKCKPKDRSHT